MIRVHQNKKQKATISSTEETKETKNATKSSKIKNRRDACEEKTNRTRSSATSSALRILQSGANSSYMLKEKLARKGYSHTEIEEALCELKDAGLLDDKRLFFAHAEFLATRKFYGKRRVHMELMRKFDRETVDTHFEEALAEIDFSSYCLSFAKKNVAKGRDALLAKLARQGYASSEIRYAVSFLSFEYEDNDT